MIDKSKNLHQGHRKRLKEKFNSGKESFKEHELLELLLSYALPRKDTNALAHSLINKFGCLQNVLNCEPELLKTIDGVGDNIACFLSLIGYITAISSKTKMHSKPLSNIEEAKAVLLELFKGLDHEVFYVLFLNNKNKVISMTKLDDSSKNSVTINFEAITKGILIHKPTSIIVAHNHFSKYPMPSKEDDLATEKIYTLLQFYKVNFYDHLIVSGNEIYSYFYDNRLQQIKNKVNNK